MKKSPRVVEGNSISRDKEVIKSRKRKQKSRLSFSQRVNLWLTPSLKAKKYMNNSRYLPMIRSIVSVFNGYYRIHYLTIIVILILVISSGKTFNLEGLLVAAILIIYSFMFFLDKWLKNLDNY